ncbi:DNA helicase II [Angomonas deanei]|uniref:DNA 3'-5' helicase n=1 Tax=Angomonas deanei TaxID=59799 RepID=A0A7G2CHD8_9TRYP|nr:DNA helicase II [Angomonas deanei]CAD2219260.1 UvrD/REP helicase N-terminal domain/AAA domain/UvrD-like helicase C-terminal domain containing protein, putative [Angomonas deanei]|eukprot:EPY21684.1 DNA helicase II [Angomonas deanei]
MAECVVDVDHREGELMAGLDESQRVAALSDPNRPLLLFAGAGSGKTLTMASRVCFLLVMEKVPAHKILCFCFTRQATEALRRRIRRFVPPGFQTDVDRLKIKTLHSFGLECLRRFGWVDSTTEVLDGRKQRQLAKEIVEQHALIDVQEGPKRSDIIRDKVTRLIQVAQRAKNRLNYKNTTNPAGEEAEDAHLFEIYEKQLHDELKAVDFGDLQILFCQMLELIHRDKSGMTPCDILRHCYTHIIVDEFQDLNEVQMEVLALLAGDACRVSCVGDPNQCIYGWRGALYDSFDTWKGRFPHSLSSKLEVNYRSQERIVSTANTLVEVEQRAFHSLPNPSPVYQINFSPKKHNATPAMITAKMISNLVGRRSAERNFYRCQRSSEEKDSQLRYCYGDIAVLCRTQRQVSDVIDELERNQIPVSKLRNIESTANTYITGIISYLRIIATEGTEYITNSDVEGALFNAGKNKSISGHHRKNLLLSVGATLLHSLQKVKAGEKGVGTNYYEVIQNFVFHNFSTEQFPRLGRFPKTIYKVFQQFCTIVQEGKRRIALHPIPSQPRWWRGGGGEGNAKSGRVSLWRSGKGGHSVCVLGGWVRHGTEQLSCASDTLQRRQT